MNSYSSSKFSSLNLAIIYFLFKKSDLGLKFSLFIIFQSEKQELFFFFSQCRNLEGALKSSRSFILTGSSCFSFMTFF